MIAGTVEASLYLNDALQDAKTIAIPKRDEKTHLPGGTGVNFDMHEIDSGILKLELKVTGPGIAGWRYRAS